MLNPIQLTKDLVSINSCNPFKTITDNGITYGIGNESEINIFIENVLKSLGFQVERQVYQDELKLNTISGEIITIPKRWNILASKGNFKQSLLYLAHTDTVGVNEGWQIDPFKGEIRTVNGEERFYALGSNDMKAGIASILCGAENVNPIGYNIKIAFVSDEEYWSYGADHLTKSDFLDDVKLCVVPEIMDQDLSDPNCCTIGLGRLGRVEFLVELEGKSCHGSEAFKSNDSINAVHESIKLQNTLLSFISNSKNYFNFENTEIINSAYLSKHDGGLGVSSVPEHASFILDRGLIPSESVKDELDKFKSFILNCKENGIINKNTKLTIGLRPRPTPACEPYIVPIENHYTKWLTTEVLKIHKNVKYGIGLGVADENRIAKMGIPALIVPPRGEGCHTSEEWVNFESIIKCSRLFQTLNSNHQLLELFNQH